MPLPQGTITLLFTDIEGSTRLSATLGDEYAGLLEAHRTVLRESAARQGGIEVDTQGDAVFVVFTRARDAVTAAVDAQRGLASLGHRVRVRMGIHTGEPQLTEGGYYVGVDLSLAARICSAAHGAQILISPTTRELVGEDVAVGDLGEHVLKDIAAPVRLYQVLAPGLQAEFPPPRARPPGNLARAAVEVYGRAREVRDVKDLLRDHASLVTLTGAGGVGKTTTAIAAAGELRDDFRDGIYFVSLATADNVVGALARTLEVEERPGDDLVDAVVERLEGRAILLVLDDFDALVGSAPVVGRLLERCAGLKVLATSRERLHLRLEHEYRLEPLADGDAANLFAARAVAAGSLDDPAGEGETVHAICRRVDGLPLAIELAAARARALPLRTILDRLEQRLRFLTGGARDLPERQQALTATIAWSYGLLAPAEQAALRSLAVFAGGIPVDGAEAVLDDRAGALDLLISLRDKSLLARSGIVGAAPRFSILDTIREYALERLAAAGEQRAARDRHAAHFLALARRLQPDLDGPRQAEALRRLGEEHENLRAALSSCDDEMLLAFCAALWRFWLVRGHLTEGRRWLGRALAGPDAPAPVRAEALFGACAINAAAGEFEAARRFGVRRAEVTRALGDDAETASALQSLANVSVHLGDRAEAARLYEEAAAHARAAGNRPALAAIVNNHGYLELLAGDAEAALASCSEAASLFAELEKPALGAGARLNVATALVALDRPAEAAAELGRALDAYLELEYEEGVSYCLDVAAAASLAQGDARAAASLASAAAALREKSGVAPEPVEQRLHEETVTAARSELGDDAFADAAREGAALPLDSLVTSLVLPA